MSVGLGFDHQDTPDLKEALRTVGDAAKAANKGYASFIGDSSQAKAWANDYGVHMFFVGSEHNYMRAAANKIAQDVQNIDS